MRFETNTQLGKLVLAIAEKGYGDVFDEVLLITVMINHDPLGSGRGSYDSSVGFRSGVLMLIFSWLGRKQEANLGKVSFKCAMVMSIRYDVQLVEVLEIIILDIRNSSATENQM